MLFIFSLFLFISSFLCFFNVFHFLFHFFRRKSFFFSVFLYFFQIFFLLALVSEFNCFLRSRCSMEMCCRDDIGRDSWDWVGPPAWGEHASTPQSGVEAPRLLKRSLPRLYYCCCCCRCCRRYRRRCRRRGRYCCRCCCRCCFLECALCVCMSTTACACKTVNTSYYSSSCKAWRRGPAQRQILTQPQPCPEDHEPGHPDATGTTVTKPGTLNLNLFQTLGRD